MPEKKFDLNKALQAARLYIPIEYGYIPQFDISMDDFNNSVNNVLSDINWVGSGARARKEEQEKRDNIPWYTKIGYTAMSTPNPGDTPATSPLAANRYMVSDVEGGKEIQKMQDTVGSIAGAASTLGPMGISGFADTAATYGLGHAIGSEALSWGTGAAGYHGFNKLGNWIDKTYGTNTRKWLPLVGSIAAGGAGYSGYLKGITNSAKYAINNGIRGYKDFPNLQKVLYQYAKPSDIIEEAIPTKQLIYNNRGPESGMSTYFKTAKYTGNTGNYNDRTVPSWQLPKADRFINEHDPINISLVNRSDSFIPVKDGKFVFDSPEKAGKLATLHFTQHTPVTSHGGGDWSGMSTTLMLPYGNVRKTVAPLNIEVMDTFFPNYNGLQIKTDGAKVLTADKRVFDYYTKYGVDVEFSDRLAKLRRKYRIASKMRNSYAKAHNYYPDEQSAILDSKQSNIGDKIQKINEQWTADNRLPVNIDEMQRLEKIENMKSYVTPLSGSRSPIEDGLGFRYNSAPTTHWGLTLSEPGDYTYENSSPYIKKYIDWINSHKADYRTITE